MLAIDVSNIDNPPTVTSISISPDPASGLTAITATATSEVMTVLWQTTGGNDNASTHADNLTFIPIFLCSEPFADADGDADVDREDFGVLQACITGDAISIPPEPQYCSCFDRDGNDHIEQSDITEFEKCATGPEVKLDPEDETTWPGYGESSSPPGPPYDLACDGVGP